MLQVGRPLVWSALVLAIALFASFGTGRVAGQASSIAGTRPSCVNVEKSAVFNGTAYNHLVMVRNTCDQAVACSVTTNANPTATNVTVRAGGSETVNTFLGSPAREFTPTVDCTLSRRR